MDIKDKVLEDCRKILRCHIDKEQTDWDLWWRQVHAMDDKYQKHGEDVYRFMQRCIKDVFTALRSLERKEREWR